MPVVTVLMYVSLATSDAERLSCTCWLLTYLPWKAVYSYPLPFFKYVGLCFYSGVVRVLCGVSTAVPCLRWWFADAFSRSVGCVVTFSLVSFEVQKFLTLMKLTLLIVSITCILGVRSKKSLLILRSERSPPVFPSKSFILFTFRSVIYFGFTFVFGEMWGPNSFFPCGCSGVPVPFFEKTVLSPMDGLGILVEIS